MYIEEFLTLKGTKLSEVTAALKNSIELGPRNVLIAVGSLAEGLGNSKSDLDFLLVISGDEEKFKYQDHMTLILGKCLIDIQILRQNELQNILDRLENWLKLPWNVTQAAAFTLEERILIHRLIHGVILYKGEKEQFTRQLPARQDVARLKLHVARHLSRAIQVDMVGYREERDYTSLVFSAQEMLGHTVDALLAGFQLTNFSIKWRFRLLELLPPDWENLLVVRPTGMPAGQYLWNLHRTPEYPSRELALKFAFRITTFARAVFMWAEAHSVKETPKPQAVNWPRLENADLTPRLPYLDFDVDFFLNDTGLIISRLNEFGEVLEIPASDSALILLFDGATTESEADRVINALSQERGGSATVSSSISRIVRAGFTVSHEDGRNTEETDGKYSGSDAEPVREGTAARAIDEIESKMPV